VVSSVQSRFRQEERTRAEPTGESSIRDGLWIFAGLKPDRLTAKCSAEARMVLEIPAYSAILERSVSLARRLRKAPVLHAKRQTQAVLLVKGTALNDNSGLCLPTWCSPSSRIAMVDHTIVDDGRDSHAARRPRL
jgi:hypothetical protein